MGTFQRSEIRAELIRSPRSILVVNGPTKCGAYLLASSLTAALLDGLFEHLAWMVYYRSSCRAGSFS